MEIVYLVFLFFLPVYLYIWFILENDVKRVLLDRHFTTGTFLSDRMINCPKGKDSK